MYKFIFFKRRVDINYWVVIIILVYISRWYEVYIMNWIFVSFM